MGTVVIHAGMGKAGSSSIQAWLSRNAPALRQSGICLLTAHAGGEPDSGVEIEEYRSGLLVANDLVYAFQAGDRRAILARLFTALEAAASRARAVVLSAEALEGFFFWPNDDFLSGLDELGTRHEVRVAYYVRPQHDAFEAQWRQWGFRRGLAPSEYMHKRSRALNYFETYKSVAERAPRISFKPRPFRRDLLADGGPGVDFARHFLGIHQPPQTESLDWANRGLPLELVNALRYAPPGVLWDSGRDNTRLNRIKRLVANLETNETREITRSRSLLQSYCFEVFEPGNAQLIAALGWDTDFFVPKVEPSEDGGESPLATLDELWEPRGSETELKVLYSALAAATAPPATAPPAARPTSRRLRARWRRAPGTLPPLRLIRRSVHRARRLALKVRQKAALRVSLAPRGSSLAPERLDLEARIRKRDPSERRVQKLR